MGAEVGPNQLNSVWYESILNSEQIIQPIRGSGSFISLMITQNSVSKASLNFLNEKKKLVYHTKLFKSINIVLRVILFSNTLPAITVNRAEKTKTLNNT